MSKINIKSGDGAKAPRVSKIGQVLELMRRPEGATVAQMMELTGWQAHSVRGVIAGQIKKKLKLTVATEKTDAGFVYRVVEETA